MDKFVFVVFVLALIGAHVNAEQFVFQSPVYTIVETPGVDNEDTTQVKISRTGTTAETSVSKTITISTDCPNKITATASSTDFEIDGGGTTTTVTFPANDLLEIVDVTIKTDDEEEFREFFCLTIVTDPGSEYTTTVFIPGNDYCVNIDTPGVQTPGQEDDIMRPNDVKYIGPWYVGDTGYPDVINIDITAESGGGGTDINIFLSQNANQQSTGDYYGIFLDDTQAVTYTGLLAAAGDSVVVEDGTTNTDAVGIINDVSAPGAQADVVDTTGPHSFTLQYNENTGDIDLVDQDSNAQYSADDNDGNEVDVSHVFVSSGPGYASWKVCGLLPRKLPIVGADATGYIGGRSPDNAYDGFKGPVFTAGGCFQSDMVTKPWLQIDLGKEYDVKLVLIYPMDDPADNSDASSLNDADVYVGSCSTDTIATMTSNNMCGMGIGPYTDPTVIEVKCRDTSYGRYVYIHQGSTTSVQFSLCEVEVYGDDIPYGETSEATIQFSAAAFETADDESAATVSITAKRTGSSAFTCTTADFYTDTVTLPGGSSDDFTAVLSTAPYTFSWDAVDKTTAQNTKTYSVPINNDPDCEPDETFNVYLTNVNGGVLGAQSWSTVTIIDDDMVTYALSSSTFRATEGSMVNIGVTRTGTGTMQEGKAELTFTDVTADSGDYANAADYVQFTASSTSPQYHQLSTVEDQEYEGDETVTLNLGDLYPTCSSVGTPQTATLTITDDDSQFEWNVDDDSITIDEGTATTTLAISREGVVQPKTIDIDVDVINADSSSDFSISSNSVTFAATKDSESITVTVVDDSTVESDESFTLTLEDPNFKTGHKNLGDPYRVTVTIKDNDAKYSWSQAHYYATESDGNVQVCLERQGDTSTTKTIQINSASGTATSGADFTPITQVTFTGTEEKCTTVSITNGNDVESTEVFTLTIVSGQQDVELGTTSTATVEIADDDYTVTWEMAFYSFEETSPVNYVTISKSGTGSPLVTITSQQETARQGIDYAAVSTSITLSGSTASIPVTIYDNDEHETSRTFTITLSGTGFTSSTTRVTIIDDDPAPTEPPPEGLSVGAIAGIVVAAVVGAIVVVVAAVVFYVAIGGGTGASTAAGKAAAAAAAQGVPLGNYQLSGLDSFGNGLYNGYGNGLSNQGFGGFNQQSIGFA